jgi:quinoprotein glucose dehydrogenase
VRVLFSRGAIYSGLGRLLLGGLILGSALLHAKPVYGSAPARQETQGDYSPFVAPASEEAAASVATLQLADGLGATLFAAEPMLANPVCLYVANDGSLYVGETFRHHAGVTDMREHMGWLNEDLASQSLEDRVAMIAKHEGDNFASYSAESDRLRLIRDDDGDHVADRATVFAQGFNHPGAGIGAGVLEYEGSVYYTCIPDLWLLRDEDGDDRADVREVLSTGYGINIALLGHDLHGLRIGPDKRLYFSSGDRGFRVETPDGLVFSPKTGAVLRCNLDGSNLEIVHSGLRNPQELVFDEFGNLWTGDNNSDGGDQARWVHIVEGADSGWRYPYQWINSPNSRGPWNDEKLWHPPHAGQAAYVLPPIANLANGPSGLTYNPGTGLSARWDSHFFLADFRGARSSSGIHAFTVKPKGAFWELGPVEPFVWNTLVTDCDFGPDGAMYITDWVAGWNKTGKGRVYRVTDEGMAEDADVLSTQRILKEGFGGRGFGDLKAFLLHPDMRVRQGAQFKLAELGSTGIGIFTQLSRSPGDLLARLHSIWGIGIYSRRDPNARELLVPLLEDPEPEIRAQAIKVLGEERHVPAGPAIAALIADENPRVRFFAAIATGRLKTKGALENLRQLLVDAGTEDPNLRHAAVMGLLGVASKEDIFRLSQDASAHVRMGALLVLRRHEDAGLVRFLMDVDPLIVFEAARAIHDLNIEAALPAVALTAVPEGALNGFVRRVMNANFRIGGGASAQRIADLVERQDLSNQNRIEGLSMLKSWANPEPRDRVNNFWRPLPGDRADEFLPAIVADAGHSLGMGGHSGEQHEGANARRVRIAWAELAGEYTSLASTKFLRATMSDADVHSSLRVAAFQALDSLEGEALGAVIDLALAAQDGGLRAAGLEALQELSPADVLPRLDGILSDGELPERRAAYAILGKTHTPEAVEMLLSELRALRRDEIAPELALDLILAAEANGDESVIEGLHHVAALRNEDSALTPYLDSFFGGDAQAGRRVFERADLSCLRCHAVNDEAGDTVGPDLRGLSARLSRLQMLESILEPNVQTTEGYGATVLFFEDGSALNGRILKEGLTFEGEAGTWLRLQDSDGELHDVLESDISERRADLSAMPEGLGDLIDRRTMRDLLAYLASL